MLDMKEVMGEFDLPDSLEGLCLLAEFLQDYFPNRNISLTEVIFPDGLPEHAKTLCLSSHYEEYKKIQAMKSIKQECAIQQRLEGDFFPSVSVPTGTFHARYRSHIGGVHEWTDGWDNVVRSLEEDR